MNEAINFLSRGPHDGLSWFLFLWDWDLTLALIMVAIGAVIAVVVGIGESVKALARLLHGQPTKGKKHGP